MKKRTASIAAAALMLAGAGVGGSAGTADASTLPPGATAGSSTISAMLGANAPQGTAVKQGDRIRVQRLLWDFNCTLGYVDPRAGVGYTAGHCGLPGEPVLNANYQIIGHFEASNGLSMNLNIPLAYAADVVPSLMPQVSRGMLADVARIRFNPGVVAGGNAFSGDRVVPLGEVRHGDRICAVGAQSQRVVCGTVDKVNGDTTYAFQHGLIPGDSGGPAWIPGKGFVGVNSGGSTNMAGTEGYREAFAHPRAL
ncbi:hypothetical protein FPH17_10350 [Corynebacterium godavarianum]|uniref:Secreted protein n=1 Tax=Corynebacterium godavarianum TaxID=2054421 RepID=A0ABY3DYH9_9CORY|nr:hypothetical protein [Corynebacterium godavarianum]MBL7284739.1 hypothetical protein [Corynebacterium godavarianum]TSJ71178.1 hypothetical protein FPH17_10350 [Corynebacterium godavarianum]